VVAQSAHEGSPQSSKKGWWQRTFRSDG